MVKIVIHEDEHEEDDIRDYVYNIAKDLDLSYRGEEDKKVEEGILKYKELSFQIREKRKQPHNLTLSLVYKDKSEVNGRIKEEMRGEAVGESLEEAVYDRYLISSSKEELEEKFAKKLEELW